MQNKAQKRGNGLAVRIPKPFAQEAGLEPEAPVDISVRGGTLGVVPLKPSRYRLAELLRGVKAENLHGEQEPSLPTGRELW